jgi:hypothetical protein
MVQIVFDTRELYFLTQYLPVHSELERRGIESTFVAYHNRPDALEAMRRAFDAARLPVAWFATKEAGLEHYRQLAPDWIVFGNGYAYTAELPERTRTAMLYHAIGMKSSVYAPQLVEHDVRFVEGPHYVREIGGRYPDANLVPVGYAKVDPLFWPAERRPRFDLAAAGLDPKKPTLLYAPTHSPSSFGRMGDDFPADFADFNVVVKPHYLSFFSSTRRSHRRKMELWSRAPNCYVAPIEQFDPIPFMLAADVMVSDLSSVLFEYTSTGKPAVWCDFLDLPWSRRGIFSYRLKVRLDTSIDAFRDVAAHARRYRDLREVVQGELEHPERRAPQRERATQALMGTTDGFVSERIADWLIANLGPTTRTRAAAVARVGVVPALLAASAHLAEHLGQALPIPI